jgi:hypothetical protein
MADFRPDVEAQALNKMLDTHNSASWRAGGAELRSQLMDEVQKEWCALRPEQQKQTLDAMAKERNGWKSVSNGRGEMIGVFQETTSNPTFTPLKKCE